MFTKPKLTKTIFNNNFLGTLTGFIHENLLHRSIYSPHSPKKKKILLVGHDHHANNHIAALISMDFEIYYVDEERGLTQIKFHENEQGIHLFHENEQGIHLSFDPDSMLCFPKINCDSESCEKIHGEIEKVLELKDLNDLQEMSNWFYMNSHDLHYLRGRKNYKVDLTHPHEYGDTTENTDPRRRTQFSEEYSLGPIDSLTLAGTPDDYIGLYFFGRFKTIEDLLHDRCCEGLRAVELNNMFSVEDILELLPRSVKKITIGECDLDNLPSFDTFLHLKELSLRLTEYSDDDPHFNQISVLPPLPKGLEKLELDGLELTELPSLPVSLKTLVLEGLRELKALPGKLPPHLEILAIEDCPKLDNPHELKKLSAFQKLYPRCKVSSSIKQQNTLIQEQNKVITRQELELKSSSKRLKPAKQYQRVFSSSVVAQTSPSSSSASSQPPRKRLKPAKQDQRVFSSSVVAQTSPSSSSASSQPPRKRLKPAKQDQRVFSSSVVAQTSPSSSSASSQPPRKRLKPAKQDQRVFSSSVVAQTSPSSSSASSQPPRKQQKLEAADLLVTGVGVRTVFTPLEQKAWEGVVSQVRGKSGARQNCPFLAHGLLHFVLFGTVATVETRPATAKYYAAVKGAHIHVAEKGLLSLLQRQWDYAHNGRQVDMTRPASPTDDYYASYVPIANIETRLATMAASHGGWLVGTLSLSGCAVFTDKQNQQYQQTKKLPTDVQVPQGHVVVFQYVSPEHSKEGRIPSFMLFEPQSLVNGKLESPEARLVYDDISQAYPFLSAKRSEVEIGFDPYVSIVPFHSPSLAKGHLPENKRMKAEAAQGFFAQRADGELRVSPATEPVSIPIKMDPGSSPG